MSANGDSVATVKCGNPDCFDMERRHVSADGVRACFAFSYTLSATFRRVAERYARRHSLTQGESLSGDRSAERNPFTRHGTCTETRTMDSAPGTCPDRLRTGASQ